MEKKSSIIFDNRTMVFGTGCGARPRGRSGLMFHCQTREQKPQGKGQNGHFKEFFGS